MISSTCCNVWSVCVTLSCVLPQPGNNLALKKRRRQLQLDFSRRKTAARKLDAPSGSQESHNSLGVLVD